LHLDINGLYQIVKKKQFEGISATSPKYKNEIIEQVLLPKWESTLKKELLEKDLAVAYDNNIILDLVNYLSENATKLLENIVKQSHINSPFIVFFWIENFSAKKMEVLLRYDQKKYIEKGKAFNDSKKIFRNKTCPVCGEENTIIGLPTLFNVGDNDKFFVSHYHRNQLEKTVCCSKCSEELTIFKNLFLSKIKLFPLFINNKLKHETIELLKSGSDDYQKNSFRTIIQQIYKKTSEDNLDFYLIQYDGNSDFISFDYITGFGFYKNGLSVFQLESILDKSFFDNKLCRYYFSEIKPPSKSSPEEKLKINKIGKTLYRYRTQIFDYIYRAKYNSLNKKDIADIYMESLKIKLKDFFNSEKKGTLSSIIKMNKNYFILNKYFGGKFMETVERIKKEKQVTDDASFAFFTGQIVRLLLRKSQAKGDNKTHAMVEPFINIRSLKMIYKKVEELFSAYKHKLNFNDNKFNAAFSSFWQYLLDNIDKGFTEEMKIAFYAGYFDNESLVYTKNSEGEKND